MISESLRHCEIELLRASAVPAYSEVERLSASLCLAAAEQTRLLPAGDSRILEIAAWLDQVLESAHTTLVTARSEQAAELRQIYFLQGYLRQPQTVAWMSRDI